MTRLILRAIQIVPVFVLLGASVASLESPLKCGSLPPGAQPVYAVDGVILAINADSALSQVDRESILSIAVLCMNPRDSTFNRTSGIPVFSVWTREGPVPHLEPALSAILAAQNDRFRHDARYFDSIGDMDLPDRPHQLRISLEIREGGWIATATIDRYLASCFVFDGDIAPPYPHLRPRLPACVEH